MEVAEKILKKHSKLFERLAKYDSGSVEGSSSESLDSHDNKETKNQ